MATSLGWKRKAWSASRLTLPRAVRATTFEVLRARLYDFERLRADGTGGA